MTREQHSGRWRDLPAWLICLFAFALPISIAAAEPLAFLCVIAGIGSARGDAWRTASRSPFLVPVLLFSLLAAASVLWSVRPEVTLGRLHRLAFMGLIFAVGHRFSGEAGKGAVPLVYPVAAFCAGASLLAVYDLFRIPAALNRGIELASAGNMRDPQMYLVAICLLAAVALNRRWVRWRPFKLLALLPVVAALVLHLKRGVWVSLCIALLMVAALSRRWKVVVLLVLGATLALSAPPVRSRVLAARDLLDPNVGGRYLLWTEVAPKLVKEYPQGMGWCAPNHEDLLRYATPIQENLDHLHNNLLQVTAELGWVGLGDWLIWMGVALLVVWKAFRARDEGDPGSWIGLGVFCALIGLLSNGMVEYNFGDSEILMLYCLLMGLGEALRVSGKDAGRPVS